MGYGREVKLSEDVTTLEPREPISAKKRGSLSVVPLLPFLIGSETGSRWAGDLDRNDAGSVAAPRS